MTGRSSWSWSAHIASCCTLMHNSCWVSMCGDVHVRSGNSRSFFTPHCWIIIKRARAVAKSVFLIRYDFFVQDIFCLWDRCCCDAFSTVATHVIDLETEKAMSKLFIEKLFKYLLRVLQILRKCKAIVATWPYCDIISIIYFIFGVNVPVSLTE